MSEASATTRRELGGYEITTTGGTVSIFFARIFTEIEDSRTANTNAHTNYEIVQVSDVIDSGSDSDECWGELKTNWNTGYHPYQAGTNMVTSEVKYQGDLMT